VAELIQFKVTGKEMTEARPKGDKANYVKAEAV
jgi:hypothetical protein